jgi:hypothetical protein
MFRELSKACVNEIFLANPSAADRLAEFGQIFA